MNSIRISKKLVGGIIALALLIPGAASAATQAETIAAIQAQIAALQAQIMAYGGIPSSYSGIVPVGFRFQNDLRMGSTGDDVYNLQRILNASASTRLSLSGAGSPGAETMMFGGLTHNAVIRFQEQYRAEILTPVGLSMGTGYVGAQTRNKLNGLIEGSAPVVINPPVTCTTNCPVTPNVLTISGTTQPANASTTVGAQRVPFTRVVVRAPDAQAVTVVGIAVERQGTAANETLAGVYLLDDSGNAVGLPQTLDGNNKALVGASVNIPAGQSRTFTVVGNLASTSASYAGRSLMLPVTAVHTSTSMQYSGTFPIFGATYTIN